MFSLISALLSGLCLFILGMKLLTSGLQSFALDDFRRSLTGKKLSTLQGLFWGTGSTMLLQSSSGTTVILVGLAESGLLTLTEIAPIVMGANVGSTITAQLIAMDVGRLAPFVFLFGLLLWFLSKQHSLPYLGEALVGFSLIFLGMDFLNRGVAPLHSLTHFQAILGEMGQRPLLGILMGFFLAAIIQSSSTGIALLQSMAISGTITLTTAIPILMGLNMGTCATAFLASLPLGRKGKQVAAFHLLFNLAGTLLMYPFIPLLVNWVTLLAPYQSARQVAHSHTLFNLITTLLLLPFMNLLVRLVQLLLGERTTRIYK